MSDETRANATVFDYLRWRGDLTLAQDGFNEVDSLILCIISYINLKKLRQLWSFDPKDAMPMGDVCRHLTEEDEQLGLSTLDYIPLMRAAAETARFRDVSLFAFESLHDEAQQMQFAAVSFLLPDGSVYVAYRGTDMTIVGWQEDFNMSFLSAVPAQLKATEYAEAVARACPRRPLRIGGHSKGGNLAAWAAVHLDEKLQRKRLIAAYNNDGPGFRTSLLPLPEHKRVAGRIVTIIPESSVVGILLEHEEHGDMAACVAVNEQGKLVAEDLWNGFDDEFLDAVKEYLSEKWNMPKKLLRIIPALFTRISIVPTSFAIVATIACTAGSSVTSHTYPCALIPFSA